MVCSGSLLKCALVALVLVVVAESGSAAEKLATCCTKVNTQEITEPILGYLVQKRSPPCIQAVIFQTETGLFCSHLNAPWVRRKIVAFENAKKAQAARSTTAPPSKVSLLSIITSTASLPSSSAPLPSFSSTSKMPSDEISSEGSSK